MNSGYTTYYIQQGDTLPSISQRILGDASLWYKIAIINKLEYPYITDDLEMITKSIKGFGQSIIIPSEQEDTNYTKQDINTEILGCDIFLTMSGEGIPGEIKPSYSKDVEVAKGLRCLQQDLINRLMTTKGSLPYHPEYGSEFTDIIGHKKGDMWIQRALAELIYTFKCDSRVVDVINTYVEEIPQGYKIYSTVVTPVGNLIINEYVPGGGSSVE